MLLKKIPVSCPAIRDQIKGLSRDKSKISFLCNDEKKIEFSRKTICQNSKINAALINGYEAINKELEIPLMVESGTGIGIVKFFEGKNIFITGGTGLLGKVLVEKILRSTPVGKIYVLVKADDSEAAMDRLAKELVNSDLFGCVQEKHGKYYQKFIKEKLIPVVGNISYVNGEREGIILEKPLIMGENRRNDDVETSPLFRRLDVGDEINLALRSCTATSNYDMTRDMKRLGMERAKFYGWYNTYHLSKAMAEMVIHETRGDIPVLIIRPSVIESCYKQPYPGWIQGNRMFDPIIISYGKGQLPAFLGDPNTPMDIIPLDIVVNTTIAAIAKHACMGKSELNVYQLASGFVNPLRFLEFFEYIHEYFSSDPLIESESFTRINYYDNLAKIKYFDNFDDFSKYTREEIFERLRNAFGVGEKTIQTKIQKQCKAKVAYAEHLSKMYEFLGFFKARFDAGNTQKLLSEMSNDEKMSFAIDVKEINWRKYFQEVHIPGLRKHVLNDKRISI
ncbi:hypothetical protein C2S51_020776 [Perilla frutescens var. frutescens]|nr:hypothetical protein C2S51_020776 [Perilla frutescens var. frutescens]